MKLADSKVEKLTGTRLYSILHCIHTCIYLYIPYMYVCRQGSHLRPQHPGHQRQPCGRQERHEHHSALPTPPPLPGAYIRAISVYILYCVYTCILVLIFYVQYITVSNYITVTCLPVYIHRV